MYSEKLSIIKQSLGSCYESNEELLFYCPKCSHHKRKLSVNIEKNVFKCWICDFKGNTLLTLVRDRELRSQWKSLTQQVDLTRFDDLFSENVETVSHRDLDLPSHFSTLTTPNLSKIGQKAKNYLLR